MKDLSRRNFFAGGAAAGVAGAMAFGPRQAFAQGSPEAFAGSAGASGKPAGLPPVWGEEFLYQWSPPENLERDLTPGTSTIRMSSQIQPRLVPNEATDYDAYFANVRALGWSAVESASTSWTANRISDSKIRELKEAAAKHDIVFYGLHCAGNIIAPDPDADRWQRHIVDSVRMAEELGCELILTHAGSMYSNRNWAHPKNWSREAWMRSVAALKRICKDTAGSKIKIAIEAVNTESVNNPWAHARLREDVGDPRITVGLDITNMVYPGVAFRMTEFLNTTFDLLEDQIAYVHAKDFVWNSMLPGMNWAMNGTGNMDYETFLVRLSRLKSDPYMLVEFLDDNEDYVQAQRNIRAIAAKVGVKIHGTQP
ncbi:MAG TPA: sugar phosphate isomerase/epimerase family protein [Sphingobium sp.]|nr:sugar phosphate isomerase/epimerase family protein [Sphingobium sp.]